MQLPIIMTIIFFCLNSAASADEISERTLKEFEQAYRREKTQQTEKQKLLKSQKNFEAQNKKRFDEQYQQRMKKMAQERQGQLGERFKDRQKNIRQERAKIKREMTEAVDPMYKEALQAYKAKDYSRAQAIFAEIEQLLPGYKQTQEYLARRESQR